MTPLCKQILGGELFIDFSNINLKGLCQIPINMMLFAVNGQVFTEYEMICWQGEIAV